MREGPDTCWNHGDGVDDGVMATVFAVVLMVMGVMSVMMVTA